MPVDDTEPCGDSNAAPDDSNDRTAEDSNDRTAHDSNSNAPGEQSDGYVGDYDKLVRDDIPRIIRDDGNHPVTRRVDGDEYDRYLAAKLAEEAREYADALHAASTSTDAEPGPDPLDELADVHAVLDAIVERTAQDDGTVIDDVRRTIRTAQREKTAERGGFTERIVLERIEPPDADS